MVAVIHAGLDNLAIKLADRDPHHPLQWVPPPDVSPDIPMGEVLPEPGRLGIVWPRKVCEIDVPSPAALLPAPNDSMRLRIWPTTAPRRGTVVLVPPWKFHSFMPMVPIALSLNRMGFDVVGYPIPYHYERTPEGTFSGEYFATWDMPRTGLAIRTAALELCAIVESLRQRGPVAMMGLSLGGYLSAMTSVVAPLYPHRAFNVDRLVLVVPPASILDTFLKTGIGDRYRKLLVNAGGTVPDDAYLYRLSLPFSPSRFKSCVPGENILVAAARHDTVVPLESSRELARGLGAQLAEYEAGHVSGLLLTFSLWRDVGRFLENMPRARDVAALAKEPRSRANG